MDAYRTVVVVHGADGGAPPGEALRTVAAALPGPPGGYQRSDLLLGEEVYPRLVSAAPSLPELIEVPGAAAAGSCRRSTGPVAWLWRLVHWTARLADARVRGLEVDPAGGTRQAHRDLLEGVLLWSVWPVLLTLSHTVAAPASPSLRILLDVILLASLVWLVRSQWRAARPAASVGAAWLGICLVLSVLLWRAPQWRGLATTISIRVYGLGQLAGALVLLAMALAIGLRVARRRVPWREGLVVYALAVLPFGLAWLLTACLWALVLNVGLALAVGPVLDALKGWQQTFAQTLGYHLAAAEWGAAAVTALLAVVAAAGGLHGRRTRCGRTARGWLLAGLALLALGGVLVAAGTLLSTPYLRAPFGNALRRIGAGRDVATLYTWSALRLVPWLLLLLTPLRGPLRALVGACAGLICTGDAADGDATADTERLSRLLAFLDRGRHDRIHLLACGPGAATAMRVLAGAERRHPLVLTTLGSPVPALGRDLLGRTPAALPADVEWQNLYRRGDPVGGPVGDPATDVVLEGTGQGSYWSEPALAQRIVAVLQGPA